MSKKIWLLMIPLIVVGLGAAWLIASLLQPQATTALPTLAVLPTAAVSAPSSEVAEATAEESVVQPPRAERERPQRPSSGDSTAEPRVEPETPAVAAASPTAPPVEIAANTSQPGTQTVAGQVIITFAAGTRAEDRAAYIASIGGTATQDLAALDTVVVSVPADTRVEALPPSNVVAAAEPDYFVSAQVDDPLYATQWALPVIGAPEAWAALPVDAPTVVIAVIDSGVCADHPELAGKLVPGYDFIEDDETPQDAFGHGCAVAGVIAANHDTTGIAGVAPNARIMALRVLDQQGVGQYSDVIAAITYAADHGAQIINLSLGGSVPSDAMAAAVQYAVDQGVLVIAAGGNTGGTILYPAAYEPVVAVGSLGRSGAISAFSARGAGIDVFAPGEGILATGMDNGFVTQNGTSFAAPHVAGVAALEIAYGRSLTADGGTLLFGGSGTITVGGTSTPTPTPGGTTLTNNPTYASLLQQAQQNGSVRLMIGLNVNYTPQGYLTPQQVTSQQAAIVQAQQSVVQALSGMNVTVMANSTAWEIPYLALRVDAPALQMVANLPQVTGFYEDSMNYELATCLTDIFYCDYYATDTVNANDAWYEGYTGSGYTVAVLDTGVQTNHTFFSARVLDEACFSTEDVGFLLDSLCSGDVLSDTTSANAASVSCGQSFGSIVCNHGTHVTGIVAGDFNGTIDTLPLDEGDLIAPDATILAAQVFTGAGDCSFAAGNQPCLTAFDSDIIGGLNWVYSQRLTYNIASVNVSIGGGSYSNQATCDAENAPTKAAIDSLRSFNIATVIASGNNSSTTFISAPGCISSAIAVGATGSPIYPDNDAADANRIANFSNQNFMVDLVAPGVDVYSSVYDSFAGDGVNATDWNDGTSMAAPVVAGAWAVARSAAPAATVSDLLAVFQSTGIPIADSTRNTGGGGSGLSFRRVNLDGAVDALVAPPSIPVLNSPATNTFQNSTITLNWSRSTLTGTSLQSTRYHLQVARDIGFTQLLTGFTPLIINNTAVTPTVSQVLAAQPAGNTYYWRVQAVNQFSGTGSGYTAPFVFYTDGSPTLNFFTTSTPEISWARITWATQYEVQIATNNTFAVPVLVGGASVMRDGSTFSYTTPTLTEGTYFFRVRGLPPAGTAGAWSAIGTFVVDLP